MARRLAPALLVLTLASTAAADVLDVHPTLGPYTEIRDAVAAAQDGDVIRVASGAYGYFGVFGKGVEIVPRPPSTSIYVSGAVRVQDVPAGSEVILSGVRAAAAPGDSGLTIAGCDGSIRVDGGRFSGSYRPHVRVLSSSDVALVDTATPTGDRCIYAEDSRLSVFGGTYVGNSYWFDPNSIGVPGDTPIQVIGGRLQVHGCTIRGGHGGDQASGGGISCSIYAGDGGNGIAALDADVHVTDCVITGGLTGDCWFCCGSDGAPVRMSGTSTATYHPGARTSLLVSTRVAWEGDVLQVSTSGSPGDPIVLSVAFEASRTSIAAFQGDVLIGGPLGAVRRVFLGAAPVSTQLTMPQLPAFGTETFHLQVAQIQAGRVVMGPTRVVTVLDSAW